MTGEGDSREPGGGESPLEDVSKKLGDHLEEGGFFQSSEGIGPSVSDEEQSLAFPEL